MPSQPFNDPTRSATDTTRWLPVRNKSKYWVPAFGCVYVPETDPDTVGSTQYSVAEKTVDGVDAFEVWRPDASAATAQDPAQLLINGPLAIEPGGYGSATMDMPCRALFGATPGATRQNGQRVGPVDGQFYLGTGDAFTLMGNTARTISDDADVVWIHEGRSRASGVIWFNWTLSTAAGSFAEATIQMIGAEVGGFSPFFIWSDASPAYPGSGKYSDHHLFPSGAQLLTSRPVTTKVGIQSGLYHVDCYCSANGLVASSQTDLGFVVLQNGKTTPIQSRADADFNEYGTSFWRDQALAASGPLIIDGDSYLSISELDEDMSGECLNGFLNIRKIAGQSVRGSNPHYALS